MVEETKPEPEKIVQPVVEETKPQAENPDSVPVNVHTEETKPEPSKPEPPKPAPPKPKTGGSNFFQRMGGGKFF